MTDAAADPADAAARAPKRKPLGLILGIVAALALGGGGFYAVRSGIVDPGSLIAFGGSETRIGSIGTKATPSGSTAASPPPNAIRLPGSTIPERTA